MYKKEIKPIEAYCFYLLNRLSALEILELKDYWLSNNILSDSLIKLCYSSENEEEIYKLFESSIIELNISKPIDLECRKILITLILDLVVNEKVDFQIAMNDIYFEFYPSEVNKEYIGDALGLENIFMYLREFWDCRDGSIINYYNDITRYEAESKFKEHVLDEAKNWLLKNEQN